MGWNLSLHKLEWSIFISDKYLNSEKFSKPFPPLDSLLGLKIWNNIIKSRNLVAMGIEWQIGDGETIHF